jgi:hypothetical protein
MNIRKLMGRLNANAGSMDGGRGGIPEMTPQDIAAAIGMARDEIGREIFCFAWWPDAAKLLHSDLHASLRKLLLTEFSKRFTALSETKLALHMLESGERKNGAPTRALIAAQEAVQKAGENSWPRSMEKYDDIVEAVITEVCAPRQCPNCGGKGQMMHGALAVKCGRCKGRGTVPLNKSWRARHIGVGETAYRTVWRQPYEWLYAFVSEHEACAAEEIRTALGRDIRAIDTA